VQVLSSRIPRSGKGSPWAPKSTGGYPASNLDQAPSRADHSPGGIVDEGKVEIVTNGDAQTFLVGRQRVRVTMSTHAPDQSVRGNRTAQPNPQQS
jgi:hypothetical protein